ncbi:deacylase [Vibrio azureus]|uniref:Succinylglutamate desuccinylase/Aspartoacylase catalytic domain-containing protein n=1 Tax=Vibrio azureus NBRC 104587 TaxID=1219077 RepID=U3C7Q3_9VIBR|nr:succinylglutamate desuccinylase/aspartoacylase family protein [Vibrio azureus]AUI88251.1 deacylase [Vibrio azureus]GAD77404.1 hypothetical protein VAZ01S_074_00030 [Vibrio azureus NBRC 104587]
MPTTILSDTLQGHSVLQSLDVSDLPAGEHKFWFRIATNAIGQWQHTPVWVFKGASPGKKVMITAGVHGDEYNGVLAAQSVARQLIGERLSGTVTVVPTINLTGMLNHSRDFVSPDPDLVRTNLNRCFPGNEKGKEAHRYLSVLWQNLLQPNADLAIDLHTQTSGAVYPLYVFADFRRPLSKDMARWLNPDVILNDPGEQGVLETTWQSHDTDCITVEIGQGRYISNDLIQRTTEGVFNILKHQHIVKGQPKPIKPCLEGNEIINISANQGGFVIPQVTMLQAVEEKQLLAIQYDGFGSEVERYFSPANATVLSFNIEPMRAAGSLIVRLIR